MSNPADNTEGCEVCGLDRQVLGCRPGKCKNEKAPPLGYTKCPTPECPRWMGPNRLKCWSEVPGGNSGVIYPDWEPPASAAPKYPLPWRWENWERLIDAKGDPLIEVTDEPVVDDADEGPHSPTVLFANSYVRAVTERAGAMERALHEVCASLASYLSEHDGDWKESGYEDAVALLVEIDAAKGCG